MSDVFELGCEQSLWHAMLAEEAQQNITLVMLIM